MGEFADALALTLSNTDEIKWPLRSKLAISSVGHLYALEYMEQLSALVQTYNTSEWHKAFSNSLSLLKVSHHVIDGLVKAQVDKKQIAKYIWMIIEVSDILGGGASLTNKNHILLSNVELEIIYDCFERIESCQDLDNLLKLSTLLWAYADSIYFQGREMCCEYHGLYTIENGLKVLVRDYKNFNPVELWPELTFDLRIKDIRIITFHKNDFSITVDVYNNIQVENSSFKESCVAGLLFIDGKRVHADIITELMDILLMKLEKQTRFVNKLSKKELYRKYVYLFWYRKKYLTDFLHLSWNPSEKALETLDTDNMQETVHKFKDVSVESFKKQYDYSLYI